MNTYLIVEWDTNDGDYIREVYNFTKLSKESKKNNNIDLNELLTRWIKAMKDKKLESWDSNFNNWPVGDYTDNTPYELYEWIFTEEEIDFINDNLVPFWFDGIHDITRIDMIQGDMNNLFNNN